jgi:hexosaminidase
MLTLVVQFLLESSPQPPPPQNFPPIWPLPGTFTNGTVTAPVASPGTFAFTAVPQFADLDGAIARYSKLIFPHATTTGAGSNAVTGVLIRVANTNVPLQLGVDESYTLTIPADGSAATITASTYYGALWALETFSQLVRFNFDTGVYEIAHAPWYIKDAPRFPHRGVLIDTSRHFEPVETIEAVIDSLTYSKLNVLHWHLVDEQSFPFDSPSYPLLGRNGAYSPDERYVMLRVDPLVMMMRPLLSSLVSLGLHLTLSAYQIHDR